MEPERRKSPRRLKRFRWHMDERIGSISGAKWHCAYCPKIFQNRQSGYIEAHLKAEHGIGIAKEGEPDCVQIAGALVSFNGRPLLTPPNWFRDELFGVELGERDGDKYWGCAMCTQAVQLGTAEAPRRIKWHLSSVHRIYGLDAPRQRQEPQTGSVTAGLEEAVIQQQAPQEPKIAGSVPIVFNPRGWQRDVSLGTEFTDELGTWWWSCAACPQTFMRDTNQMRRIKAHLQETHEILGLGTGFIKTADSTPNPCGPEPGQITFAPDCPSGAGKSTHGTEVSQMPIVAESEPNWMNHFSVGNVMVDDSGERIWLCAWCSFTCSSTQPATIRNHLKRLHEVSGIFPTLHSSFNTAVVDPLDDGGLADLPHGHWVYHPSVGSEFKGEAGGLRWACAWCPKTLARKGTTNMLEHLRGVHGITDLMPLPGTPGGAVYPQPPGDPLIPDEEHSKGRPHELRTPSRTEMAVEQDDFSNSELNDSATGFGRLATNNDMTCTSHDWIDAWSSAELDKPGFPSEEYAETRPIESSPGGLFDNGRLPTLNPFPVRPRAMNYENLSSPLGDASECLVDIPAAAIVESSTDQTLHFLLPGADEQSFATPEQEDSIMSPQSISTGVGEQRPCADDGSWESQSHWMTPDTGIDALERLGDWKIQYADNEQSVVDFRKATRLGTIPISQENQKRVASQELTRPASTLPCGSRKKGHFPKPGQTWVYDPRLGSYHRDEYGNGRWRCAICSHSLVSRHLPPLVAHLKREHNIEYSNDYHAPGCACFDPPPEAGQPIANSATKKPKSKHDRNTWLLHPSLGSEYTDRSGKVFWRCQQCLRSFTRPANDPIIKHLREAHDIHDKERLEDGLSDRRPTTEGTWIFHQSVGIAVRADDGKLNWRCAWCPATILAIHKAKIMYHLRRLHDIEDIIPGLAMPQIDAAHAGDQSGISASGDHSSEPQELLLERNRKDGGDCKEGGRKKNGWVRHPSVGSEVINQDGVKIWRCAWCPKVIAWKSGCQMLKHLANTHNITGIKPSSGGGIYTGGFPHEPFTTSREYEVVPSTGQPRERPLGPYQWIEPNPHQA